MNWVIGSGIAGLCLARELALAGREVTLCGPPIESSASWAAGGLLQACGGRLSPAHFKLRREAFRNYPLFLDSLGEKLEYSEAGHIRLATNPRELSGLLNFASTLCGMGVEVSALDSLSLRERENILSSQLLGGCLMPDARVEASSLLLALESSWKKLGVHRDHRSLLGLSLEGEVELQFADGSSDSTADHVYLACGAQTEFLLPQELRTYQGRCDQGESCWFEAPAMELFHTIAIKSRPYTLLPGSGRWCFAGGGKDQAQEFLQTALEVQVPLEEVEIRGGLRVQAPDGLPVAGPTADSRVSLLTGLGRNGILTAPHLARLMVEGNPEKLAAFSPQRMGIDRHFGKVRNPST